MAVDGPLWVLYMAVWHSSLNSGEATVPSHGGCRKRQSSGQAGGVIARGLGSETDDGVRRREEEERKEIYHYYVLLTFYMIE